MLKGRRMCSEEGGGREGGQAGKSRNQKGKNANMGAELLLPKNAQTQTQTQTHQNSPLILGLQPSALIDHVAKVDWSLLAQIPGEAGGSIPVSSTSFFYFLFSLFSVCVHVFCCCWEISVKLGGHLGSSIL